MSKSLVSCFLTHGVVVVVEDETVTFSYLPTVLADKVMGSVVSVRPFVSTRSYEPAPTFDFDFCIFMDRDHSSPWTEGHRHMSRSKLGWGCKVYRAIGSVHGNVVGLISIVDGG